MTPSFTDRQMLIDSGESNEAIESGFWDGSPLVEVIADSVTLSFPFSFLNLSVL